MQMHLTTASEHKQQYKVILSFANVCCWPNAGVSTRDGLIVFLHYFICTKQNKAYRPIFIIHICIYLDNMSNMAVTCVIQ